MATDSPKVLLGESFTALRARGRDPAVRADESAVVWAPGGRRAERRRSVVFVGGPSRAEETGPPSVSFVTTRWDVGATCMRGKLFAALARFIFFGLRGHDSWRHKDGAA